MDDTTREPNPNSPVSTYGQEQYNSQGQTYTQASFPPGPQTRPYQATTYGQPVQTQYGQTMVVTQPTPVMGAIAAPAPPDYMIPSIMACLFCFCPTGLLAIYFANRRTNMLAQGDILEAQRSADCARNLMIASIIIGICWIIVVIVLEVVVYSTYNRY